jgi:hypothetical protein
MALELPLSDANNSRAEQKADGPAATDSSLEDCWQVG